MRVSQGSGWGQDAIRALVAGVTDPEGRTVYADAGSIAHMLRHRSPPSSSQVLETVREAAELWEHPEWPRKVTYRREFDDGFGGRITVVAVAAMIDGNWEVQSAFKLWRGADWGKLGTKRRWPHA